MSADSQVVEAPALFNTTELNDVKMSTDDFDMRIIKMDDEFMF